MNAEKITIPFSSIVFDEGLYPRVEGHDPALVQTYARDMEQIEAAGRLIAINADNALLDGRHRMLAYKKRADGQADFTVPVLRYPISSPLESFRLACRLQDRGKALSNDDRVASAKRLYALGDQSQKEIADSLGVSPATVSSWLSRTIKEEKERKRDATCSLWLACHTQEEIAERLDIPQRTVADWTSSFSETLAAEVSLKPADFEPPICNVWKQQTKSDGPCHFGNSEVRWLDNLLYLYTNPNDVVVDPFAGSWIDIDCCHYCKYCNSLLALFELVHCDDADELQATCRRKCASITHRAGIRLGVPVYKIAYTGSPLHTVAVQQVGKPQITIMSANELARFINELHNCEFCRERRNGRFQISLPTRPVGYHENQQP